jgi:hypothetical protein
MFINLSAAQRVLKDKAQSVIKLWHINFHQVCIRFVGFDGLTRNTIVKRDLFRLDAQQVRETGAIGLKVKAWGAGTYPDHHSVSGEGGRSYTVKTLPTLYSCECKDFREQRRAGNGFGKPVCKHLISVARYQGFGSFKEMIQNQKVTFLAA